MRVVDAIAGWLEKAGIQHYFGYAGGAIWPLMDALVDKPNIIGLQAKQEGQAVHMADMYFRVTGKIAPIFVTKGPGLLNCLTGVASAINDSSAVMIIAGAGSTHFLGKGGMQEIYYHGVEDAVSVFRPLVKGAWAMVRPDTAIDVLNQAYKVAISGRPGPVFVQVPFDVQLAEVEGEIESPLARWANPPMRADAASVEHVTEMIRAAERPVILAGGGVALSRGAEALKKFVEKAQVPAVTTLTAKGILPEDHALSVGVVGRSGMNCAAQATREADLIVAVGARFSDNHTSNWRQGLIYDVPRTKIVHVDVDPAEIGRNYPADVGLLSDGRLFFEDLLAATSSAGKHQAWIERVQGFKKTWYEEIEAVIKAGSSPVHPARLCYEIGEVLPANGRLYVDIGDITQYAEAYTTIRASGAWHCNPGMAEMSWASTGILGGMYADPSRPSIAVVGDGAFNMSCQVVASAVEYNLPAIWVINNNNEFGIERKGSFAGYQRLHPWTQFVRKDTGEPYNPNYPKLAEAFGALGEHVEKPEQLRPALERALASGRPYVIDVATDPSVPTYFTSGLDRAYPSKWGQSYPSFGLLKVKQ